jgi:hypothetical protein
VQVEVQGLGRSPAALIGSLSGIGTLSLDGARLAHLDPKVFDTTVRAVDQGLAIEPNKVREFVAPALEKADLLLARASGPLTVTSGQVRVINLMATGEGVDVAVTGELDLNDGTVDGRLTLTGSASEGNPRPDLFIVIGGPLAAATRTIDASALTNWLLLRSLDREATRVDAAEPDRREPAGPADQRSSNGLPPQNSTSRRKPAALDGLPAPPDTRSLPGLDHAPTRPRRAESPPQAGPVGPPGGANPSVLDRLFGSQR